ncbi:hypothetical protein K438DRAFT_571790 [Mycena galopus ATCC 62051]|nr:hypothetical protein K438DRAFT_571790 [Mycena galopus ATCC 62051]
MCDPPVSPPTSTRVGICESSRPRTRCDAGEMTTRTCCADVDVDAVLLPSVYFLPLTPLHLPVSWLGSACFMTDLGLILGIPFIALHAPCLGANVPRGLYLAVGDTEPHMSLGLPFVLQLRRRSEGKCTRTIVHPSIFLLSWCYLRRVIIYIDSLRCGRAWVCWQDAPAAKHRAAVCCFYREYCARAGDGGRRCTQMSTSAVSG